MAARGETPEGKRRADERTLRRDGALPSLSAEATFGRPADSAIGTWRWSNFHERSNHETPAASKLPLYIYCQCLVGGPGDNSERHGFGAEEK